MLTVGSLFSGIGGLDLGLEQAGMKTVWQVEYDDWARGKLDENFPHTEKFKDVREVGKHNLRPVDLICGGFPCQDVSHSNQNGAKGLDGQRSGLWVEYFRLLCELRPRYTLIENVAKLAVFGLDRVLSDLASIGFDAEWQTLYASQFGKPHRRARLFIIAYSGGIRQPIFNTNPRNCIENDRGSREAAQAVFSSGIGRHPRFSLPQYLCVDNGISFELSEIEAAIKGYGNAVCPPVAKWIGERIIEFDERLDR